jgi:hypothetical protein
MAHKIECHLYQLRIIAKAQPIDIPELAVDSFDISCPPNKKRVTSSVTLMLLSSYSVRLVLLIEYLIEYLHYPPTYEP